MGHHMDVRSEFDTPVPTIVLAEGAFGRGGGKTANGVVLHSELFDTRSVIDSTNEGRTTADVLRTPDAPKIPIVSSVADALDRAPNAEGLVLGVAPAGGALPASTRARAIGGRRAHRPR